MLDSPGEKQMKLRYAGACRLCGTALPARVDAIYERSTKTVRCLDCSPAESGTDVDTVPPVVEVGTPGSSARREYERRHANREARVRKKHPKIGGFLLAISDDPQSTTAWDRGAHGEERLGERLNDLACDTIRVLHDRRIPGSRANIDHIAVSPTGVYVIDAKRYAGQRPTLQVEGGLLRPRVEKLLVGGRDRTKLVDAVLHQVEIVRAIVGADVPVTGVLCFIDADWPLLGGAFTTRGVGVLWPKRLSARLGAEGPHAVDVVDHYTALATALRCA